MKIRWPEAETQGHLLVPPAHDLFCWVTAKKDDQSCRLIYPRGIPLSAAMLGGKASCAGCKWVFVRGQELISVLGFGKLVTSCHLAFSSSLSEQVATDWQAFSEVEEDICVFHTVEYWIFPSCTFGKTAELPSKFLMLWYKYPSDAQTCKRHVSGVGGGSLS